MKAPGQNDLIELKNIGAASANILHSIGVHTDEDLRRLGSVAAYCKIKQRGIKVSKVMLYALEGALLNLHWTKLDPDLKHSLLSRAESLMTTQDPAK